jgi:hypothetical protein
LTVGDRHKYDGLPRRCQVAATTVLDDDGTVTASLKQCRRRNSDGLAETVPTTEQ